MQLAAFCCSFVCCLLDWLLGCCSVLRWAVPCLALLAARPTHSHYNLETLMKLALLLCFMTSFRSPLFVCCWLADFACSLFVLVLLVAYLFFVCFVHAKSIRFAAPSACAQVLCVLACSPHSCKFIAAATHSASRRGRLCVWSFACLCGCLLEFLSEPETGYCKQKRLSANLFLLAHFSRVHRPPAKSNGISDHSTFDVLCYASSKLPVIVKDKCTT